MRRSRYKDACGHDEGEKPQHNARSGMVDRQQDRRTTNIQMKWFGLSLR